MIKRNRRKQTQSLEQRLEAEAIHLRQQAGLLPAGFERDRLLRKVRQAEAASRMTEWLKSPGLQAPT
jgi:hypothetical protein